MLDASNAGAPTTTYYLYNDTGLMAELNAQGHMVKAYGWSPQAAQAGLWSTDPVWQAQPATPGGSLSSAATSYHYLHTDHLSTPMLATDKTGQASWKGISEAFGQTRVDNGSQIEMNLRFPGQYWDRESKSHYNYFRDYQPHKGRYLQSDPIGLSGGVNTFAYVGGDPLGFVDPTGEFGIAGAIGGAVVNATIQFSLNYFVGGGSAVAAGKCIDFRKVITSAAIGAAGPTLIGNKIIPMVAGKFGRKAGVEFAGSSIAATMGAGFGLNTLTSLSEPPPLNFAGADECECQKIRVNIKHELGDFGNALSGIFF